LSPDAIIKTSFPLPKVDKVLRAVLRAAVCQ
jgi:hypothetical protein